LDLEGAFPAATGASEPQPSLLSERGRGCWEAWVTLASAPRGGKTGFLSTGGL